jgi:hypothetical protein
VTVEPPDIETFGENVGTLTSEVFGLEVTAVHDHLCQDEESWQKTGLNSWQAACYGH